MQKLQEKRTAAMAGRGDAGTRATANPAWTQEDQRVLAEFRRTLATKRPNRQANPAIAETVMLEVTLAPDAPPGERELRLRTPNGLSNPLAFCIGGIPEFSEPAVTATSFVARRGQEAGLPAAPPRIDLRITLPTVVNGQILPGEVDRYRFMARKGQRLVLAAAARALMPYLADAVPGWFQATLALYDSRGRELVYDDDFRFNPDPVLFYQIAEDGEYTMEIKDAIYRGREDFVYRISVGELPFVTGIFPLGGRAGERPEIQVAGWNLSSAQLMMETKDLAPGSARLFVSGQGIPSNPVAFALDDLPEGVESEPNDTTEQARPIAVPFIVNGRIDRPDDLDVFCIEGRAGDEIVAEVFARRLNSPLDSTLKLTDAAGRRLALNDDHEDKGAGLTTHHADSRISAALPADGAYFLHLGDAQRGGGAEYGYRLRIAPPRPDFELRVVPSSVNLRGGASVPITVYALRRDGFNGGIALELMHAPATMVLSGARIPVNQDKVHLTVSAPPIAARDEPYDLALVGHATIQGRPVVHAAVPAEDMMQAFAYRHLVPAHEWKVTVTSGGPQRPPMRIIGGVPLRIPAGGTSRLRVAVQAGRFLENFQFELSEPPAGVAVQASTPRAGGFEVVLTCDGVKAKPGLQGNLILEASATRSGQAAAQGNQRPNQRLPLGPLPAIPFEIVAAGDR